jgi:hypothetical protein
MQELKTNKLLNTEKDIVSFERYKLIKFWAQAFIAGIPRVVVGYRDDDGIGTPTPIPPHWTRIASLTRFKNAHAHAHAHIHPRHTPLAT